MFLLRPLNLSLGSRFDTHQKIVYRARLPFSKCSVATLIDDLHITDAAEAGQAL